jgi:hypothetical protein
MILYKKCGSVRVTESPGVCLLAQVNPLECGYLYSLRWNMQRIKQFVVVACLAVCLAGCGNSAESQAKKMIAAMSDFCTALESGNRDKAKAALANYVACIKEFKNINPTEGDKKRVEEIMKTEGVKVQERLSVAGPKAMQSGVLKKEDMEEFMNSMMDLMK